MKEFIDLYHGSSDIIRVPEFGKGRKHAIKELKVNSSVSDEKKNEIKELFKRLDLNV